MYLANMISRRSLLRGLGAGTCLLAGMSKGIRAQSLGGPSLKAAFFFHANGSHPDWTPTGGDGPNFVLTDHLAPLEPVRGDLNIMRNMILQRGSGNPHGATTKSALGAGSPTSFDQQLADRVREMLGADAPPLSSLEMTIGETTGGGGVVPGLSQRDGQFIPGYRNPLVGYNEAIAPLVQPGTVVEDDGSAQKLLAARRSLLDHIRDDITTFNARLGAEEKPKLQTYLDAMRDLENRLGGFITTRSASCGEVPEGPDLAMDFRANANDFPEVNRMFLDVMALALACGVTHVTSIMWGGGQCDQSVRFEYKGHNIDMGNWHGSSHQNPQGSGGESMKWMQAYLAEDFAYFVEQLKAFPDGQGTTVLDNAVVVWGTQCGISTQVAFAPEDHDRHNTPLILAGKLGGAFTTGKMIDCDNRNHNDVYLAIAQAFDPNWGDAVGEPDWNRGPMPGLSDPV